MGYIISILITVLMMGIFQISVLPNFFSAGRVPDILLVFTIILTTRSGFEKSFWRIILIGFILDMLSFNRVGVNIISLVLVSLIVSYLAKRFLVTQGTWKNLGMALMVVAGTLIYSAAIFVLQGIINSNIAISPFFLMFFSTNFVFHLMYNVITFATVNWAVQRINKISGLYGIGKDEYRV